MTAKTAILADGCFCGIQALIRLLPGVISTRVGYTGGDNDHPVERSTVESSRDE
jgi:peptide-methionine (S)-S-oxide reductase